MHKNITRTLIVMFLFMASVYFFYSTGNDELLLKNALCVGIDIKGSYLSYDAITMKSALEKWGFTTTLLINENATYDNVIDELTRLGNLTGEIAIFFSAKKTHGEQFHLVDEFLPESVLSETLGRFKSEVLVVINTCGSGNWLDIADSEWFSGVFLTASDVGEETYYVPALLNSIFVEYFAEKGIVQGLADKNNDGVVSIDEAFNYAYINCRSPPSMIPSTHPQIKKSP